MPKVAMQFITTTGIPIGDALVQVRLTRTDFDDKTSGVLMTRLMEFRTEPDGSLLVELAATKALYHVTAYDTVQDIAIHYDFYVPASDGPDVVYQLKDIFVPPDTYMSSMPFDEVAMRAIIDERKLAQAAAVEAGLSEVNAEDAANRANTSAANAQTNATAVASAAADVTAKHTQVGQWHTDVANDRAAVIAAKADTVVAKTAAEAASVSATGSATNAGQSATAAAGSASSAQQSAQTANAAMQASQTSATNAANSAQAAATSLNTAMLEVGGNFDAKAKRIINAANSVADTDLITQGQAQLKDAAIKVIADKGVADAATAQATASAALPKSGGTMTGALFMQANIEVGFPTTAALSSAMTVITGQPTSGELNEVHRFSVVGIPNVSYGGAFRVFTSTNGLYSDSFLWDMRGHDMNRNLGPSILSVSGAGIVKSNVVIAKSGNGAAQPRSALGYPNGLEASLSLSRWGGSGVHDKTWRMTNDNGVLRFQYADYGVLFSSEQEQHFVAPFYVTYVDQTQAGYMYTDLNWSGRYLLPKQDNTFDIGLPAQCYRTIYARTGTINTSDARLKTELREFSEVEIVAACKLARAIGIYRWNDAVQAKGADAREHVGPTVQLAIQIMTELGLDPFNYGFVCHDEWEREVIKHAAVEAREAIEGKDAVPASPAVPEVVDEDGNIIQEAMPATEATPAVSPWPATPAKEAWEEVLYEAGDRYAFRYDELSMFICRGLVAAQDNLNQRLVALEEAAKGA